MSSVVMSKLPVIDYQCPLRTFYVVFEVTVKVKKLKLKKINQKNSFAYEIKKKWVITLRSQLSQKNWA